MNFVSEKEISNEKGGAEAEPIDNRTLYERLKEVRDKKQLEIDEAHKFKNQFRGIDEDEADFLRLVNNSKNEAEIKRKMEEKGLIEKIACQSVSTPESIPIKPKVKVSPTGSKFSSKQASLISMGVRKRPRNEDVDDASGGPTSPSTSSKADSAKRVKEVECDLNPVVDFDNASYVTPSLCQVIGVLPALVAYNDSSDDESNSSNSDDGCAQSLSYLMKSAPAQNGGAEATGGCNRPA